MNLDAPKRKTRARPELSVFDEELNIPFNPKEFLPDVPSHARVLVTTPASSAEVALSLPTIKTRHGAAPTPNPTVIINARSDFGLRTPTSAKTVELGTNFGQTSDKPRTEPRPDSGQSSDKPRTNSITMAVDEVRSSDKPRPQPRTEPRPDFGQTSDKLRTNGGFFELVGLQRQITIFLHEQSKLARDRITDPIAISLLAERCGTTSLAAQKTIQRLTGKGIIRRVSFRNGRGGWTRYEVVQDVFQEILHLESQDKLRTNLGQTPDNLRSQPRTQPRTAPSSSSSFLDLEKIKTTTTGEPELFENTPAQLTPEWQSIDVSPLAESGFTQTHLIQILRQGKLQPTEVQDSIYFFAFDLARNGKGRALNGSPLNFFMGILRKGIPYAPPENFESPADEVRRKTREFKERKERERQAEDQKLLELEFAEWSRGLAVEELTKLLPEYARKPGAMQTAALKTHFEANVWPERAQELLRLTTVDRGEVIREIEKSLEGIQR